MKAFDPNYKLLDEMYQDEYYPDFLVDRPAMYLSSRNFAWDTRHIFLVVSHDSVNDGNHLPAGVAHGCHIGFPFVPFLLKIEFQCRIVKHC